MVKTREITVLAWNLKDGLSDPSRADTIAEKIAEIDPDIAVFSEGAAKDRAVTSSARKVLESHAGRVYVADYQDVDGRIDQHRLVAVAKPEFGEPSVLPAYGRNGFFFMNGRLPVKVAGLHGFDRDQADVELSDEARIRQIRHTLMRLALDDDSSALVIGDLNSMYRNQVRAAAIRATAPFANRLPAKNPGETQSRLERAGSISQRLAQMALGGSLEVLNSEGFRDSNPHHQATMYLGPLGVQLDHIMGRRVEMFGHDRIDPDGLSDHYGVSTRANVFIRKKHRK